MTQLNQNYLTEICEQTFSANILNVLNLKKIWKKKLQKGKNIKKSWIIKQKKTCSCDWKIHKNIIINFKQRILILKIIQILKIQQWKSIFRS